MKTFMLILMSSLFLNSISQAEPYYSTEVIRQVSGFDVTGSLNCRTCASKDCRIETTFNIGDYVQVARGDNGEPWINSTWDNQTHEYKTWFYAVNACWIAANRKYLQPVY